MDQKVSILISAYNEENYILDAVYSCLNQTYDNIEVIIFDDGSIDNTYNLITKHFKYNDRVKIIRSLINRGKIYGFNRCFEESSGYYIHLLGGDDCLYDTCIEECIDSLTVSGNRIGIHSIAVTDRFLNKIDRLDPPNFNSIPLSKIATTKVGFPSGSWIFDRGVADMIFPIPKEIPYEDIWFNIVIKTSTLNISLINLELSCYRQNSGSVFRGIYNTKFETIKFRLSRDIAYYEYILTDNPLSFNDLILELCVKEKRRAEIIIGCKSIIDVIYAGNVSFRDKASIIINNYLFLKTLKDFVIKFVQLFKKLEE